MQSRILGMHKGEYKPAAIRHAAPHVLAVENAFLDGALHDLLRKGIKDSERNPGLFATIDISWYLIQE
jgi:hypothetical protein